MEKDIRLTVIQYQTGGSVGHTRRVAIDPALAGDALDAEIKDVLKRTGEAHGGVDVFLSFSRDPLVNFLVAKHLMRAFRQSIHPARKAFLVVTHLDGRLGVSGEGNWQPDDGSLFGLVKTLAQEWPQVLCRAVDFAPAMPLPRQSQLLLQELQDADTRIAEVGWSPGQRWTIRLEPTHGADQ